MELTLLERFDFLCKNGGSVQATRDTTDEIRRAIAIAQAVEELQIAARFTEEQRKDSPIMRRADELLEGKK